ncbi:MAG: hypothetical protein KF680_03560 [Cryobacterium sp.]|nr:hypothetical protein [Cryobacterium sp.]
MIDWPNLLIGAALGALVTGGFWAGDHFLFRRRKRSEAMAAWFLAASELIDLLDSPETDAEVLNRAVRRYPLALWRGVLGRSYFEEFDAVKYSFDSVYFWVGRLRGKDASPHTGEFLEADIERLNASMRAFREVIEGIYTQMNAEISNAEHRAEQLRRLLRHPIDALRSKSRGLNVSPHPRVKR